MIWILVKRRVIETLKKIMSNKSHAKVGKPGTRFDLIATIKITCIHVLSFIKWYLGVTCTNEHRTSIEALLVVQLLTKYRALKPSLWCPGQGWTPHARTFIYFDWASPVNSSSNCKTTRPLSKPPYLLESYESNI